MFKNRSFRALRRPHLSGSITSEIFKLWSWPFFTKRAKFCVDSKNAIKIWENVLRFWHNSVWTYCGNFSHLWREYMWSAVNVLPNFPKIGDMTKADFFPLNLSKTNGEFGWKFCSSGSSSVWDQWKRLLAKGVLKQELTQIELTTFFNINNFGNI